MQTATVTAVDMDGDSAMEIVARRTVIHRVYIHNDDNATRFLHIYDGTAATVDPTMIAGKIIIPIRADSQVEAELGVSMTSGITLAASDSAAANGTAATALSALVLYG